MTDFIVALGLVFVVEGLLLAAFPNAVTRAMREAAEMPRDRMRIIGVVSAVMGIAIVWFVRGG